MESSAYIYMSPGSENNIIHILRNTYIPVASPYSNTFIAGVQQILVK
jgi:hypothetical protein